MCKMGTDKCSINGELANLSSLMRTNASNGTDQEIGSNAGPLVNLLVPITMFATGVFGNLVALLVLWRSRKGNSRSVFYRLVAGLAVTDLFGTIATSPVTILVYSNDRHWVGGQPLCHYFSFMMIFAGLATVFVVSAMAIERYLAIQHPYTYELHVSPGMVKYVMLAIWVIATLISCLPLMGLGTNVCHYPGTWCFFDYYSDSSSDKVFSFFYASVGLGAIAFTLICNTAVMCVLLRMRRVSQNMGRSTEGRTLNMTSEMQMIFFLAGIIVVFATCYGPLMVRVIINASRAFSVNSPADLLAIRLASVNQILDPWVYLLFRRRLVGLLYSACKTVTPLYRSSFRNTRGSEFLHESMTGTPSPRMRGSLRVQNGHTATGRELTPKRDVNVNNEQKVNGKILGTKREATMKNGNERKVTVMNGCDMNAVNGPEENVGNDGEVIGGKEREVTGGNMTKETLENEGEVSSVNGRNNVINGRYETLENGGQVTAGNERDVSEGNGRETTTDNKGQVTVKNGRKDTVNSVVCQHGHQRVVRLQNGVLGEGKVAERELIPLRQRTSLQSQDSQCSHCARVSRGTDTV